jgi:hypothetical protein
MNDGIARELRKAITKVCSALPAEGLQVAERARKIAPISIQEGLIKVIWRGGYECIPHCNAVINFFGVQQVQTLSEEQKRALELLDLFRRKVLAFRVHLLLEACREEIEKRCNSGNSCRHWITEHASRKGYRGGMPDYYFMRTPEYQNVCPGLEAKVTALDSNIAEKYEARYRELQESTAIMEATLQRLHGATDKSAVLQAQQNEFIRFCKLSEVILDIVWLLPESKQREVFEATIIQYLKYVRLKAVFDEWIPPNIIGFVNLIRFMYQNTTRRDLAIQNNQRILEEAQNTRRVLEEQLNYGKSKPILLTLFEVLLALSGILVLGSIIALGVSLVQGIYALSFASEALLAFSIISCVLLPFFINEQINAETVTKQFDGILDVLGLKSVMQNTPPDPEERLVIYASRSESDLSESDSSLSTTDTL